MRAIYDVSIARPFLRVLSIGLSLGAAACSSKDSSQAGSSAPPAPKAGVAQPQKRDLTDYEEFNGWLEANHTVEVRSRVRGHIHKVHFTDGQMVEKGQILFELDPRPFVTDIETAKDTLKIYEAQKVAAEKEQARLKELLGKGGASERQVEKAEADVKSLDARISASGNEVKRLELDLEYSKIRADVAGRVSQARLTEGNLVNAGGSDPLLTTIVSVDPIRLYFNIDERSLLRYARNAGAQGRSATQILSQLKDEKSPFTFSRDGEKEFVHQGTIAFGDNRIDPTTGTLQIYGTVANKEGKYIPGARVRVRVPIGKPYPAVLIPDTAILADQDQRYVLIAAEEKEADAGAKTGPKTTVRRRNVLLGTLADDGMRAIQPADKLSEGEKTEGWWVLVDSLQRVRVNYPVEPQKPGEAAPAGKTGG